MKSNYKHTLTACFISYIVQAIINNFIPLLFLTFQSTYGIALSKITFLVTFNFGLQLVTDFVFANLIDKIGYRIAIVASHIFASLGLILLAILPEKMSDPFYGLLISVMIYAIGSGLIEVLTGPIVEACPTEAKSGVMSIAHSFYCWGHVLVILTSTIFFTIFGIEKWKILSILWALVPILNGIFFTQVPIWDLIEEGETGVTTRELLTNRVFWIMVILMISAGASEQSISQWASTFAEKATGIKTLGDLVGPMMFAIMMGTSRTIYGKISEKFHLSLIMMISAVGCFFSYFLISLSGNALFSLIGCALCGFFVGVTWPGTFSLATATIKRGGTMLFAYLAFAGDIGCTLGPTVVGRVMGAMNENLKAGIFISTIFPVLMIIGLIFLRKTKHNTI